MGDQVSPPALMKNQDALLGPASSPPHLAMTHDRSVLELSRSPPLSERPGGKGRAGRREPARGSPLSLRAAGGGERVGSEYACAARRRRREARKEAHGGGRVHSQRTNGSSGRRDPYSWDRGSPKEEPEEGGVREEKTEVGRGQNGCEGCCAPPPPGPRAFCLSPAVSRLPGSVHPGFPSRRLRSTTKLVVQWRLAYGRLGRGDISFAVPSLPQQNRTRRSPSAEARYACLVTCPHHPRF